MQWLKNVQETKLAERMGLWIVAGEGWEEGGQEGREVFVKKGYEVTIKYWKIGD